MVITNSTDKRANTWGCWQAIQRWKPVGQQVICRGVSTLGTWHVDG